MNPEPGPFIRLLMRRQIACCGGPSPTSTRCSALEQASRDLPSSARLAGALPRLLV